MGVKDTNYQVVYRGKSMELFVDGGFVFFQRPVECGGGYWFGRTYSDCFWFEFESPTSLADGLLYLVSLNRVVPGEFDDEFRLEG